MELVSAICPNCRADLEVDASKEFAFCHHCERKIIIKDAINNYNTTNINYFNVENSDSADNLYKAGETNLAFGNFDKASVVFQKMTELYPYDYRGWYGLLLSKTYNLKGEINSPEYLSYVRNLENILKQFPKDSTLVDFDRIHNYILLQNNSIIDKEKENIDKQYRTKSPSEKINAQKKNNKIKKASTVVLFIALALYIILCFCDIIILFSNEPVEYHFEFEITGWTPEIDMITISASNLNCAAIGAVFSCYAIFNYIWLVAMILIFISGVVCCLIAKSPIISTLDRSHNREQISLFKVTPILSVSLYSLIFFVLFLVICLCLLPQLVFPESGVKLFGYFDLVVLTKDPWQYLFINLIYFILHNIIVSCFALLPFTVYFFIEKSRAKRQLEYELRVIECIEKKANFKKTNV